MAKPPSLVATTRGAQGGSWTSSDGRKGTWNAASLPGKLEDAYGAGDCFAAGLTFGQNLRVNKIYHPLKCEADGGIGRLATEAARASEAARAEAIASDDESVFLDALSEEVRSAYFEPRPWAIPFRRKRDDEYDKTPEGIAERDEKRKAVGRSFAKPVVKKRDGAGEKRSAKPKKKEEKERERETENERGDGMIVV